MSPARTFLLAAAVALLAPGVAGGAVTPGDYGGGALKPDKPGRVTNGDGWTWARVGADGRARIGGVFHAPCGPARFDAEVTLAADGSFGFTRSRRMRLSSSRVRAVVAVQGRFDGTAATGTVAARVRSRRSNGRVRRCSTRGAWQMRIPAVSATPAAAQPSGVYHGLTSQQGNVPRPFLLGVTRRGRIETTVFEYKMGCGKLAYTNNNVSPGARIGPDGTFRIRERFRLGSGRIVERVRLQVGGGFVAGGVAGALRVRSVVRNRRTGRVIDRCDTGRLTFAASL